MRVTFMRPNSRFANFVGFVFGRWGFARIAGEIIRNPLCGGKFGENRTEADDGTPVKKSGVGGGWVKKRSGVDRTSGCRLRRRNASKPRRNTRPCYRRRFQYSSARWTGEF